MWAGRVDWKKREYGCLSDSEVRLWAKISIPPLPNLISHCSRRICFFCKISHRVSCKSSQSCWLSCVWLQIQGPLRECCSIRPGASGFHYCCAALVCVPDVIGVLAVWMYKKTKKPCHIFATAECALHIYRYLSLDVSILKQLFLTKWDIGGVGAANCLVNRTEILIYVNFLMKYRACTGVTRPPRVLVHTRIMQNTIKSICQVLYYSRTPRSHCGPSHANSLWEKLKWTHCRRSSREPTAGETHANPWSGFTWGSIKKSKKINVWGKTVGKDINPVRAVASKNSVERLDRPGSVKVSSHW